MQFGFCPGKGTTDAIFIVRQVQEKFLGKQKEMWMAFVDLEKAFDRVPREVLWWALRHVGVEEWMVNVIKSLYEGVTTAVRRNGEESESFEVKVGVHQGSVLSPILFDLVMQAIADNFKKGLPWELLYADDLMLMAESRLELEERLTEWAWVRWRTRVNTCVVFAEKGWEGILQDFAHLARNGFTRGVVGWWAG